MTTSGLELELKWTWEIGGNTSSLHLSFILLLFVLLLIYLVYHINNAKCAQSTYFLWVNSKSTLSSGAKREGKF